MLQPKFIDHNPFSVYGYEATNEEPHIFNELLGRERFKRAACIVSGGEVLFSVVLRRSREVVGVDHSYHSLSAAYAKMALLQKLPPKEIISALDKAEYSRLQKLLATDDELPKFGTYDSKTTLNHAWSTVRKHWIEPKFKPIKFTKAVANRLTLVHGDLRDLPGLFGTFDLVYISNAMEHMTRDRNYLQIGEVSNLLHPGGTLLYTCANVPRFSILEGAKFKLDKQLARSNLHNWTYIVAKKVE